MKESPDNEVFKLAADIVSHTAQSVFLTGKAGTGKTTFLHYIKQNVDKNVIVAAPTGVAAINAGGVTLHSLLQLPFEPFIPNFEGKKKLDYHFKLRKSKIEMLRELDLLIIDEVSMLRADMLDAVDYMLRRYRNNQQPFGGVQILFIGDMFQLPPVVQTAEWELLKHYYPSPFFFHAQVLENYVPLYIELKTIYRQQDQQFIGILNRIRNNCVTVQDLQILNQRYNPSFKLPEKDRYVVLCTHNYKADRINSDELAKLNSREYKFSGEIKGNFADNSLPTEAILSIKEGAQVMFVKNDAGESRRYYNGKLATISRLGEDTIQVRFENGDEMELESETWRNVRYRLNEESGEIEEEELGSFTQYPIRLAWAITIHKSQGLTFDRVVIDAGQAFAAGQVYVALSRCTSLDGIVLFSRITEQSISTDRFAIEFAKKEQSPDYLNQILNREKPRYCADQLKKYFDWTPFIRSLHSLYDLATEKKIPKQEETQAMIAQLCSRAVEQQEIAQNFTRELNKILSVPNPDLNYLRERVQKGILYFHKDVQQCIVVPIEEHLASLKNASKVKAYLKKATEIHVTLLRLLERLEYVRYGDINLTQGLVFERMSPLKKEKEKNNVDKKERSPKGESQRLSLSLFNEGKSIGDIAKERNLAVTTIEGHLAGFVLTGELFIGRLVDEKKLEYMLPILKDSDSEVSLSAIKEQLPKECTYLDIKAVLNYIKYLETGNR
ncbi:helix-turn-helix domain-containing protein [Dysgonomonas sp. Marseille-P4677]|uniref:helix-turn-helix domain-containing protein n=1 Tax=Dysgonomonas sp. Marseille-P4677 TaxID=2364790 RepID=UPI001911B595|nr:helix-turn-helix domain-containing protein [Dysgonomonas sp. Marseille-P4677]MBK5719374.1 helix-turn-helix domain-containing protein [Dysgonomonas sp. Marseille-P4677]